MNIKNTIRTIKSRYKTILIILFCIFSFSWGMTLIKFIDVIDFKWYIVSAIIIFPIWGYLFKKK